MGYTPAKRLRATRIYLDWINRLKDQSGRARILVRIDRLAHGNPGKHKRLTTRVWELKIEFGPGYRVYYSEIRSELIVLLIGGDKSSQKRDIETAIRMADQLELDDS